jgi:hypothetical protein
MTACRVVIEKATSSRRSISSESHAMGLKIHLSESWGVFVCVQYLTATVRHIYYIINYDILMKIVCHFYRYK